MVPSLLSEDVGSLLVGKTLPSGCREWQGAHHTYPTTLEHKVETVFLHDSLKRNLPCVRRSVSSHLLPLELYQKKAVPLIR